MRTYPCITLLVAIAVCSGGCSSTVYVTLDGSGDSLSYAEFNKEIASHKLSVRTRTQYTRWAGSFRTAPDSCTWTDTETGTTMHARISELQHVATVDHFRGFWKGILYGGLSGIGVGYIVALAGDWESGRDKGLAMIGVPAATGTAGVFAGGLVGMLVGYESEYVIRPYTGGAAVLYLHDGTRVIGTVEELVPDKHVVMRTWDGKRVVIDQGLIRTMEIPKNE